MTEPTLRPFRLPLLRKPQPKAADKSATARPAAPATIPASSASSSSAKLYPPANRTITPCSPPVISSSSKRLKTLPAPMLLQSPAASTTQQSASNPAAGQQRPSAGQAASAAAGHGAAPDACLLQLPSLKRRRLAVSTTIAGVSQSAASAAGAAANAAKHPDAAAVMAHALKISPTKAAVGAPLTARVTGHLAPTAARAGTTTQRAKRRRSVQLQAAEAGAAPVAALTPVSGTAVLHAAPPLSAVPVISSEAAAQSLTAVAPVPETKIQPTTVVGTDKVLSSASRAAAAQDSATTVAAIACISVYPAPGQQESHLTALEPAAAGVVAGEAAAKQVRHQLLQDQSVGMCGAGACSTAEKRHNMQQPQLQLQVGLLGMESATAVVTADLAAAGLNTPTAAAADSAQQPTAHEVATTAVTPPARECSAAASQRNSVPDSSAKLTHQPGAAANPPGQLQDQSKDTAFIAEHIQHNKQRPPQGAAVTMPGQPQNSAVTIPGHPQDAAAVVPGQLQYKCNSLHTSSKHTKECQAPATLPGQLQDAAAVAPQQQQDKCDALHTSSKHTKDCQTPAPLPGQLQDAAAVATQQQQDSCNALHTSNKHTKECQAPATLPGQLQDRCKDTANSTAAGAATAAQSFAARLAAAEPGLLGPAVGVPGDAAAELVVENRPEPPSAAAAVLLNEPEQSMPAAARNVGSLKLPEPGNPAAALGAAAAAGAAVSLPGTKVPHCASKPPTTPPPAGPTTAAGAAGVIPVPGEQQSSQTAAQAHSVALGSAAAEACAAAPQVSDLQATASAAAPKSAAAVLTSAADPALQGTAPPSAASAITAASCTIKPDAAAVSKSMLGQGPPAVLYIDIPPIQPLQTFCCQTVDSRAARESESQAKQQVRLLPPGDLPSVWDAGFSRELPGFKQLTGKLPHRKPPVSVPDNLDQLVPQQQALAAAQQALWRSMMPRKLPASAAVAQQQQKCHRVSSRSGNVAAAAVGRPQHLQDTDGPQACRKVACTRLLRVAVLEACRRYDSDQQQQHQSSGATNSCSGQKVVTEEMIDPAAHNQPQQQLQKQGQRQHKQMQDMHLVGQQQRQQQQWLDVRALAMQQEQMNAVWQQCSSSSSGNGFASSTLLGHNKVTTSGHYQDAAAPQNGPATLTPAAVLQEQHHEDPKLAGVTNSAANAGSCKEGVCKPAFGPRHCAVVANSVLEVPASQFAAVDFQDCDAMLSDLAALME